MGVGGVASTCYQPDPEQSRARRGPWQGAPGGIRRLPHSLNLTRFCRVLCRAQELKLVSGQIKGLDRRGFSSTLWALYCRHWFSPTVPKQRCVVMLAASDQWPAVVQCVFPVQDGLPGALHGSLGPPALLGWFHEHSEKCRRCCLRASLSN